MGVTIRVVRCGRCGKPRGLRHTCVVRMDSRRKPGRIRVAPKATVTCGTCGKPRGLTHTCTVRTDFKQRKTAAARRHTAERNRAKRKAAAAERRRKAAEAASAKRRAAADRKRKAAADRAERRKTAAALRTGTTVPAARTRAGQHDYRACTDGHCEKPYCLIWKEAFRDGEEFGYQAGYETGYEAGHAAGLASCPGPHGGG